METAALSPSAVRASRGQLLIVDRDRSAGGYGRGLRATYGTSVASSVAVALRFMQQVPPDLVVTEMKLDDGSAVEICRAAKSLSIPAAVLVTTTSPDLVPDAILAGCDGVLLKPFAPNLLYARIGRIMRLREKSRDRAMRAIIEWPTTRCPYCGHQGVSSFDYASMRRAWYACLVCRKVWIAKRQE